MKKFGRKIALAVSLAALVTLGASFADAQTANTQQDNRQNGKTWQGREGREGREGRRGGHDRDGGGFMFEQLNLTDAQKEQMKQIAARYRENAKTLHQQLRGSHRDSFDAMSDGAFNESAVRAAAQARAQVQVEMEVARARMMSEMYAVLTPEQKAQLNQLKQQREQKRQERRARRQAEQQPGE